jgi:hypothetical protein
VAKLAVWRMTITGETIHMTETVIDETRTETCTIELRPRPPLTAADVERVLAERKAEGLTIDPANCEKFRLYVELMDPYGLFEAVPEQWSCISKAWFVRSLPDGYWVYANDLPKGTREALMPPEPYDADALPPF